MSRKLATIVFVLLLFVPIVLSVLVWQAGQDTPLSTDSITAVSVSYPNGTQVAFAAGEADSSTAIATLYALVAPAADSDSNYRRDGIPARFATDKDYTTLSFSTLYYTRDYRLYVAADAPDQMTVATQDGAFSVPQNIANAFLADDLARPYYVAPDLTAPTLCGQALFASARALFVRTTDGTELSLTDSVTPSEPTSLTVDALSLSLGTLPMPDTLTIRLTAGDVTLFDKTGTPETVCAALASLRLTKAGDAVFTLTATYDERIGRQWYGTATWSSPIVLDLVPTASVSAHSVTAGTPVLLSFAKPQDAASLSVTITPALTATFPTVLSAADLARHADGSYSILLPTDLALSAATDYQILVSVDGSACAPIPLSVTPRTAPTPLAFTEGAANFSLGFDAGGEANYLAHLSTLAAHYTSDLAKNRRALVAPTRDALVSPVAANGDFLTLGTAGQTLTVSRTSATPYTFTTTLTGTWYHTAVSDADKQGVYAVADGVVIGAGTTTYGGNYIVLDLGGGLCVTYTNLLETPTLAVGTAVTKGAKLGTAGRSGMTRTEQGRANVGVTFTLRGEPIVP